MAKKALIVSGGGSKGAYAVGAVDYMVATKGLDFDIVCGTSTGALIAPMVVSRDIDVLVDVYSSVRTSDIIENKGGLGAVLKSTSIYGVEPVMKLIESKITPERADRIINSQTKQMFLATVSLQEGKTVYFASGPAPYGDPATRIERITDRTVLIRAALASACIPVFQPPIAIPKGSNRQYLDGGVREVAPLRIALQQGADELYVVLLSPKTKKEEAKRFANIPSILMRTIDMFFQEVLANDVNVVLKHQESLRYVAAVRETAKAQFGLNPGQVDALFNPPGIPNPFAGQTALTIHVIQPETKDDVPLDTLEFKPAELVKMMDKGRERARAVLG